MTPPKRRIRALVLITLLVATGLVFYFERFHDLLRSALNAAHTKVQPMRLARALRLSPQEAPLPGKFDTAAEWEFENQASLKEWEEKIFKPGAVFRVMDSPDEDNYLRCESKDACSGLFVKTKQPVTDDLWISWKWRAREFPEKKNGGALSDKAEDDFAARVYVIFLASNLFRSDVIEYVWDKALPVGTLADSPYSDRIKLFVLRTGEWTGGEGEWHEEMRNLQEDYRLLFGKEPKHPVGYIALMSDSDNTRSSASADFGDITLKRKSGV